VDSCQLSERESVDKKPRTMLILPLKVMIIAIASSPVTSYFLAPGGWSCEKACKEQHSTCDAASIGAAAQSVDVCAKILETLGKTAGSGRGQYPDDNSGCTFHPGQAGWFQVMHKDDEPECDAENADSNRQRVCSCVPDADAEPVAETPAPGNVELAVTGEVTIFPSSLQRLIDLLPWETATDDSDAASTDDSNSASTGEGKTQTPTTWCIKKNGETWCPMVDMFHPGLELTPQSEYRWQRRSDLCIYYAGNIRCPEPELEEPEEYEYEYEYKPEEYVYGHGNIEFARLNRCMLYFVLYPLLCLGFFRVCRRMRQARRAREERNVQGKAPIVIECAVVVHASPVGKAVLV